MAVDQRARYLLKNGTELMPGVPMHQQSELEVVEYINETTGEPDKGTIKAGKLKKGSKEAKERMAALRKKRGKAKPKKAKADGDKPDKPKDKPKGKQKDDGLLGIFSAET